MMAHQDGVEILVAELLAHAGLAAIVQSRVYGAELPEGARPPLLLVRGIARRPTTRPTTQWWDLACSIDAQSEDPAEAFALACAVEDVVLGIEGKTPGVQAATVTGIAVIEDGGFTPTRFRNVATVEMTARKP